MNGLAVLLKNYCTIEINRTDPHPPHTPKEKKNCPSCRYVSAPNAKWYSFSFYHTNVFMSSRAGARTTRVIVLHKMINTNILKTLYSSTTRVLIFQYSYSYVQYSPQPWWAVGSELEEASVQTTWWHEPPTSWGSILIFHSTTLSCDFRPLTVISDDLTMISNVFVKLSQPKKNVEEIESILDGVNFVPHMHPWWILYF